MAAAPVTFFVLASALLFGATFAAVDGHAVKFSYTGSTSPDKWGSLSPDFAACMSGKSQSPVNIEKSNAIATNNLKPLSRDYQPANATLVNNGINIGVHFEEEVGDLTVNGKNYSLKQMHWHCPSEHTIDGEQFPAELHIVHKAADGQIAVVGILYRYGDDDPLLQKLKDQLDELGRETCGVDEESHIPLGILETKQLKRNTRKYFRYVGSLTTPPCTENVLWSILGKVRTISQEQVAALKAPLGSSFKKDARPLQQLNGRRIELYDELDEEDD